MQLYYKTCNKFVKDQTDYLEKGSALNNFKKSALELHLNWYKALEEKEELLDKIAKLKSGQTKDSDKIVKFEGKIKSLNDSISKNRKKLDEKKKELEKLQSELKAKKRDLDEQLRSLNRIKPKSDLKHPPSFF